MDGSLDGWSDSRLLESSGNTRKLSLWSPALALPQCPRRMPTRSRHHLRYCPLEDLRVYLPFTSQGPPRASTPPIPRHLSKRRPPPHKWECSRSPLRSPRHTVWWTLFQWTRAKMLMVSRTARGKTLGLTTLKFGYDQNHRRRWTPMDDDPWFPHLRPQFTPTLIFFYRGGVEVQHPPLTVLMDYTSHLSLPLSPSHYCTHAVLRPAEFSTPNLSVSGVCDVLRVLDISIPLPR